MAYRTAFMQSTVVHTIMFFIDLNKVNLFGIL